MTQRFLLSVAWRFLRAKHAGWFASFITLTSVLGIALGVCSLITVMSVLNGFSDEIRTRVVAAEPHLYVALDSSTLEDFSEVDVLATAPVLRFTAIGQSASQLQGVEVNAVIANKYIHVVPMDSYLVAGRWLDQDDRFNIVVSQLQARRWRLDVGDSLNLLLPSFISTPAGLFPRSKSLRIVGLYSSSSDTDSAQVFIPLRIGELLMRGSHYQSELAVRTTRAFDLAPLIARLELRKDVNKIQSWQDKHQALFAAIAMEKRVTSFVLLAIVAVAAFNVIAALSMQVLNKRKGIAVMRTQGLSRRAAGRIFAYQGIIIGGAGILVGSTIGVLLSLYFREFSNWIQETLGIYLFDPSIYYVNYLPTSLDWRDVVLVNVATALIAALAIWHPVKKALTIEPAEALNYE
ncbi:ABC transporter permease [uncultured Umboniibacter sp.]|uniref:ABC transporter permease n=1 Tax=uncultured Umboniibacter sp. TaxID=1798917 RepID=UPI0026307BC4|nr:ABC transporter permease [uncultured Umboniibacter sp.]